MGLAAACAGLVDAGGPAMPWLEPYRAIGGRVARDIAAGRSVAQALNAALHLLPNREPRAPRTGASPTHPVTGSGQRLAAVLPLCFVSQADLPEDEPYEAFIARTGCVPTRDNTHDLFNGLVWLRFPRLKRRLNVLQAAEIARHGVGATRGAVRDALTLFDENAALWAPPAELIDALARRDWNCLFVTHRPLWQAAPLTLFGHALLEKLVQPRKAITAHAWAVPTLAVPTEADFEAHVDAEARFAESLTAERLAAKTYLPIPVLGVPGWWPGNERPGFYDDPAVFRPLK